jgi:hypothetical protein
MILRRRWPPARLGGGHGRQSTPSRHLTLLFTGQPCTALLLLRLTAQRGRGHRASGSVIRAILVLRVAQRDDAARTTRCSAARSM